eukprot:TRINITY_DN16181_c0_g1_i3.p1 TRINITY_DN16181_c0_g1~~TRINITY_DN16181_c0_g1_i3.p1  ORF type:complete len:199 (-),score=33.62 TRINITY_DN16181_c0_g1_i3:197-793(-)
MVNALKATQAPSPPPEIAKGDNFSGEGTHDIGGEDCMQKLRAGFLNFRQSMFLKDKMLFDELSRHQTPKVMLIGCCDSRVSPTNLLSLKPGMAFIMRNIANLVPPWERQGSYHGTSAALEYAVKHLKVEHIVVMGHRNCGGIRALMSQRLSSTQSNHGIKTTDFIEDWMDIAAPARARTLEKCAGMDLDEQCRFCEKV